MTLAKYMLPGHPLMNVISTTLLALAMSTDAFAAAIAKGTALDRPRWSEALRTGAIFGVIDGLTPLVGWALGLGAASYIKEWDHWIAFVLLAGLGVHMVRAGLQPPEPQATHKPVRHSFWLLAVAGKRAEVLGGIVLVGIGSMILYEHLNSA